MRVHSTQLRCLRVASRARGPRSIDVDEALALAPLSSCCWPSESAEIWRSHADARLPKPLGLLGHTALFGLLEAIAVAFDLDDLGTMHEAIDEGDRRSIASATRDVGARSGPERLNAGAPNASEGA